MSGSCGTFEIQDNGGGSITLNWPTFPLITPSGYNVYVNGVPNQNVTARTATITGLQAASYSSSVVAPNGDGSDRPQNLPPTGFVTDALTYDIKIVAVVAGVEVAASMDRSVTVQPNSLMLTTPMKRIFPFPNTGLN
jgi:hypothetical protein